MNSDVQVQPCYTLLIKCHRREWIKAFFHYFYFGIGEMESKFPKYVRSKSSTVIHKKKTNIRKEMNHRVIDVYCECFVVLWIVISISKQQRKVTKNDHYHGGILFVWVVKQLKTSSIADYLSFLAVSLFSPSLSLPKNQPTK